ncbi:MAG: formylglycine-generating enzyme family protein, partial [Planctomycetota bacterium]
MKNIIFCVALLFLLFGCEWISSNAKPTPDLKPGKSLTNSIGMKLVYIPSGEFRMGSRDSAEEVASKLGIFTKPINYKNEHPQHRVKITKGFFLGTTEVTQAQYKEVMGKNPSRIKGEDNPVVKVSWSDAVEFCNRLSEKEGRIYRLPTEAEWEYACRAGTTTPFYTGETINTSQVNFNGDPISGYVTKGIDRGRTTSVGSFQPNGFGLYDMHGNVWEWCIDWYAEDYYKVSPSTDPQGPPTGMSRVIRGGA